MTASQIKGVSNAPEALCDSRTHLRRPRSDTDQGQLGLSMPSPREDNPDTSPSRTKRPRAQVAGQCGGSGRASAGGTRSARVLGCLRPPWCAVAPLVGLRPPAPGPTWCPHFSPRRCARLTPPRGVGQPGPVWWLLACGQPLDGLSQKGAFCKVRLRPTCAKSVLLQSWPGGGWLSLWAVVLPCVGRGASGRRGLRGARPWGGRVAPLRVIACWPPSISHMDTVSRPSRRWRCYAALTPRPCVML